MAAEEQRGTRNEDRGSRSDEIGTNNEGKKEEGREVGGGDSSRNIRVISIDGDVEESTKSYFPIHLNNEVRRVLDRYRCGGYG